MAKLTEKNKLFCVEYVKNGFNGAKAYRKAYGLKDDKDGLTNSKAAAWQLLRKPIIQEEIKRVMLDFDIASLEVGLSKEKILKVIKEMMSATRKIYDKNGNLVAEEPDWTARNNAINSYARLIGVAAKSEIKVDGESSLDDVDLKKLSPEEREELKAAILRQL